MFISKKKVIAAAALVACGAPLMAQAQTSVTVYGKLYPQINNVRLDGATPAGTVGGALVGTIGAPTAADVTHTVMESPNARLGFKGKEKLGSGMTAFFQLETAFGVDDGQLASTRLFHRNTFVGLDGGFGTVKLGRMDTVYKDIGATLSFLGVSSGNFVSTSAVLSKPGIGSSGTSFNLRADNTIMYESPEFAGFKGLLSYSLGEVPGDTGSGSILSTGVTYEKGPLYLALAHERHEDFFGGSRNSPASRRNFTTVGGVRTPNPGAESTDTATRLTALYKIGKSIRVEGNIARLEYDETGGTAGRFQNYRTYTWSLGADYRIGAFTVATSYAHADDGSCSLVGGAACSTDGLSGNQFNLGASYALSKRTLLFAIASQLNNDRFARYDNLVQGNGGNVARGQDIRQIALGLSHSF
jgi:predicted porin